MLLMVALASAKTAVGTTISVSTTAIVIADDGLCSLPEAIIAANTDLTSGAATGECPAGSGEDRIELQDGETYVLTAVASSDIDGENGLPILTDDGLVLDGRGALIRRDELAPSFRLLKVSGDGVTLTNLHFENGFGDLRGGGVFISSLVTVEHSRFTNNIALGFGGGGIYGSSLSSLSIRDSIFIGNEAGSWGGGVYGAAETTVERCHFEGNDIMSSGGSGAGVGGNQGTLSITDSTFTGNLMGAVQHGHGTLTVRRSSIWGNSGAPAVFSDSGNELHLINTTVTDNVGTTGGVRVVQSATLRNVTIFSNTRTSNFGVGGLAANDPMAVSISNSIIADNLGGDCGGALMSLGFNLESDGSCGFDAIGDAAGDPLLTLSTSINHGVVLVPNPGSPAIDSGSPDAVGSGGTACETVDNLGRPRPVDGDDDQLAICDKGAIELAVRIFADGFESGDTSAWHDLDLGSMHSSGRLFRHR